MAGAARTLTWLMGLIGAVFVAVGVVYLVVECQALPGVLGPTQGDTSPRTALGILCAVLGVGALALMWLLRRRAVRRPSRGG